MSGNTIPIHKLMREAKVIGLLWSTDDVQYLGKQRGVTLSEEQSWEILQSVNIRADLGISWDVLDIYVTDWIGENASTKIEEVNIG